MGYQQKIRISVALLLFLSVPIPIYQYENRLATAHDATACAAAYADFMKHVKYAHTSNYVTEVQFCERLESEAWICRYAAIILAILGGYCSYAAYSRREKKASAG